MTTGTGRLTDQATGLAATGTASFQVMSRLLPAPGTAWFGAYPGPGNALPGAFETLAGRRLDVFMRYYRLDAAWPTPSDITLAAAGRTLCVCWAARLASGTYPKWADIAAGRYDAQITAQAKRLAAFGRPVFAGFDNEMDGTLRIGNSGPLADYAAAYRRVVSICRPVAPKVAWCWVVTSFNHAGEVAAYPGDEWVDWIGCDPYDATLAKGSPAKTYEPFMTWLAGQPFGRGKPVGIFETGVQGSPATDAAEAAWIAAVPAALSSLGYRMWLWFNSSGGLGNTQIVPGSQAAAALRAAGASAYFTQPGPGA
jgi:hypothetical protein